MTAITSGSSICLSFVELYSRTNQLNDLASSRVSKSISYLTKFFTNIINIGTSFEKSAFNACEDFSTHLKDNVHDDKLSQYYQTLNNFMMKFIDDVHKKFADMSAILKKIKELEKKFTITSENAKNLMRLSEEKLAIRLSEFHGHYGNLNGHRNETYIQESSYLDMDRGCCQNVNLNLEKQLANSLTILSSRTSELATHERDLKEQLKVYAVSTIHVLTPFRREEYELKFKNIEEHFEKFDNMFELIQKEASTDFSQQVNLKSIAMRFINHRYFDRLNALVSTPYVKQLRAMLASVKSKVTAKDRIFSDILIDKMYCSNMEFGSDTFDQLNQFLSSPIGTEFFIYDLLYMKSLILLERPYSTIFLKKEQMRNFQQIAHVLMINQLEKEDKQNMESFYHFLRFSLTLFSENKECLIEMLSRSPLMHDPKFWQRMMDFLAVNFHRSSIGMDPTIRSGPGLFFEGIKGFLNQTTSKNLTGRNQPKNRAFEEISFLLFKMKMDYETISDILLTISQQFSLDLDSVKSLLHQNQDIYFSQITQNKHFSNDTREMFKTNLTKTREEKLLIVFRKTCMFFDTSDYAINIKVLNNFFLKNGLKIIGSMLHKSPLSAKERRKLVVIRLQLRDSLKPIRQTFKSSEVDSIIALDVKRTHSSAQNFSQEGLEVVLRNISHEEIGNFPYYQGLNYITSYFYVMFNGNQDMTYALVIKLMYTSFYPYVDNELSNMKKLFFALKRLLLYFLPTLSNYFENDLKLNTDIVAASWFLTIFTTATQYFAKSDYLDEIVDIFIAKDWPGFFQVILVIFDELQEKMLNSNFEDILVVLSDLPRTNFSEVVNKSKYMVDGKSTFKFKEKIRKFHRISKKTLALISIEYQDTMQKIDEYWSNVGRKLKQSKSF